MANNSPKKPAHPWKARFWVAISMLILSFLGVIFTDVKKNGSWTYWRDVAPVFAAMSIWLSWYERRSQLKKWMSTVGKEIFHWIGMMFAIYLISLFVELGLMGRFEGSLVAVTILALTTFLAGIYIEASFTLIGLALGLIAASMAYLSEYLFVISAALVIIIAVFVFFVSRRDGNDVDQEET